MNTRVLYVVHHHPSVMAGGAETYALELYEHVRDGAPGLDPVLLAGTGPAGSGRGSPHPGTLVEPVGGDPNQYFFHTDAADYDWFLSSARNKEFYTRYFADFLRAYRPDVVHIQHSLFFGFDMIRTIRNVLPDAAIVYTLHEYLPLCHRDGQLLKTDGTLCGGPSPRGCNGCFPEIAPQAFFLRERFIKAQLTEVDRFICPSQFLLETYARWGIPRDKLVHEPNGRHQVTPLVRSDNGRSETGRPRNRFGYFGQFTKYKGADVLLEAMSLLAERPDQHGAQLVLHGANLEHAPPEFQQRFAELLDANSDTVRLHGRYRPKDLPLLMSEVDWVIAPSRWYENAPLVIQEAFQHGRPVLCSDIGGLAEAVTDGVDGLHFTVGSATALADCLVRAATTPGLWETLSAGVRPVRRLDDHVAALQEVYQQALAGRRHSTIGPSSIGPSTSEPSASKPSTSRASTSKPSTVRPISGRTTTRRARITQAGATQPSTELTSVPS